GGEGVDVCFDAAGVQIGVDSGLKAVTARGTFVNIALWGDRRPSLDMIDMVFCERKYMAGKSSGELNQHRINADSFEW
ncbi:uncharacterized protein MYCFIDRAFT_26762, partial [Pseudocercospora fijiensis CIRAD86]